MMRSAIYRITALTLAVLMMVSSMSFAADLHYCQGQLKSFSLIGKAKKCHQKSAKQIFCPHHNKMMVMEDASCGQSEEDDCCKNETTLVDSDQDLQFQQVSDLSSEKIYQFAIAFLHSILFSSDTNLRGDFSEDNYQSPMITWDFSVWYAVFIL